MPAPDLSGPLTDGSAWRDGCETEGNHLITRGGSFAASRQVLHSAARGNASRTNASSLDEGFRIAEYLGTCTASPCNDADADSWRRWKRRGGVSANDVRERQCGEWGRRVFGHRSVQRLAIEGDFLGLVVVDNMG
ncbi:hypothetical protein [Xanthomonas phaseoli]|uniref:hypothetical protein n=1 Tax=Xanthomonas phaseoli TaxID=1985254 RepID=UPI001FD3964F|nr:hypothetical protein [Xanthomonas phaseoli]